MQSTEADSKARKAAVWKALHCISGCVEVTCIQLSEAQLLPGHGPCVRARASPVRAERIEINSGELFCYNISPDLCSWRNSFTGGLEKAE